GGDQLAVDPSEAAAVGALRRARHHAALPGGSHRHEAFPVCIPEHYDGRVLTQKADVCCKEGVRLRRRGGHTRGGPGAAAGPFHCPRQSDCAEQPAKSHGYPLCSFVPGPWLLYRYSTAAEPFLVN